MMKTIYSCNICGDNKKVDEMMGLHFSNLKNFTLCRTVETDGAHICIDCLIQLRYLTANEKSLSPERTIEV